MKFIKELIPYIIIVIVVILIRSFIVTPVKVNGASMYPTLDGGEIMILNKLGKIDRFDIVVLSVDNDDNVIKRVIGMPGETIEIENNHIYINEEKIEDKYGYGKTYNTDKITLKEDEYFVLGDNRAISLDSRVFGPVKKKDISGTASLVLYPFNKIGIVK
ncbi:MAG: signal peptidase I [Firmicutes bacterium]|nr:signal peptidase I [Bacillota bacterium]